MACRELLLLLKLMSDVSEKPARPVIVREDNQSCIALLSSEDGSRISKHIDTSYNFVRDLMANKVIYVQYFPTEQMIADILTAPLATVKLENCRKKIMAGCE